MPRPHVKKVKSSAWLLGEAARGRRGQKEEEILRRGQRTQSATWTPRIKALRPGDILRPYIS